MIWIVWIQPLTLSLVIIIACLFSQFPELQLVAADGPTLPESAPVGGSSC